jgi:hypothetical protein
VYDLAILRQARRNICHTAARVVPRASATSPEEPGLAVEHPVDQLALPPGQAGLGDGPPDQVGIDFPIGVRLDEGRLPKDRQFLYLSVSAVFRRGRPSRGKAQARDEGLAPPRGAPVTVAEQMRVFGRRGVCGFSGSAHGMTCEMSKPFGDEIAIRRGSLA